MSVITALVFFILAETSNKDNQIVRDLTSGNLFE